MKAIELLSPTPLWRADIAATPSGTLDVANVLAYSQEIQQQPNWCWAAVSVSIYKFYGGSMSQCEIASEFLVGKDGEECCIEPSSSNCNQPFFTSSALEGLSILANEANNALSFARTKTEIDRGRPISCSIRWPSGGGHAVVVYGYAPDAAGDDLVYVKDPIDSAGASGTCMLFSRFANSYRGNGRWAWSGLTKGPS